MGLKIKLDFKDIEENGEIRILSNGKILVDNMQIHSSNEGPILIDLIKRLSSWMTKNNVSTIELELEEE